MKLAIENKVKVQVNFNINNAGKVANHSFSLIADRFDQDQIKELLDDKDRTVSDVVKEVVTGWSGQKLVQNDDGSPAEFSAEALGIMLSVPGVSSVIYSSWMAEIGAKAKN